MPGAPAFATGLEGLVKVSGIVRMLRGAPSPAALPPPATTASMPRRPGMMGPVKRGLGLAGLGAAGAMAYGAYKQDVGDREQNSLVYAPMSGSMIG